MYDYDCQRGLHSNHKCCNSTAQCFTWTSWGRHVAHPHVCIFRVLHCILGYLLNGGRPFHLSPVFPWMPYQVCKTCMTRAWQFSLTSKFLFSTKPWKARTTFLKSILLPQDPSCKKYMAPEGTLGFPIKSWNTPKRNEWPWMRLPSLNS